MTPACKFVRGVVARLDGDYDKSAAQFGSNGPFESAERVVVSYNRAGC